MSSNAKPTVIDDKAADDYTVQVDRNSGLVRILHRCGPDVLSYQVLPSEDAYKMAQKILSAYDQLEGI